MATQVQFRRGTTAQSEAFTGVAGEATIDTDKDRWNIHDGSQAGGWPVAMAKDVAEGVHVYAAATQGGSPASPNTLEVTLDWPIAAWTVGMKIRWKQPANNTGASTLNLKGPLSGSSLIGAKTIKKNLGADDLAADDLVQDHFYEGVYDGTNVRLVENSGASGSGLVGLQAIDATDVAAVNFSGVFDDDTYDGYEVRMSFTAQTDNVSPQIQFEKPVSTYLTSAAYNLHRYGMEDTVDSTISTDSLSGQNGIAILPNIGREADGIGYWCRLYFSRADLSDASGWRAQMDFVAGGDERPTVGTSFLHYFGMGDHDVNEITGFRFIMSSGNVARAVGSLYGLAKAS